MRRLVLLCIPLLLAAYTSDPSPQVAPTTTTTTTTTTAVAPTTSTTFPAFPLTGVDWSKVDLPIDCVGGPVTTKVTEAHPDAVSTVAIVLATCVAGAGTPPTAALVYDAAASATVVHLGQTLFTTDENWQPEPGGLIADGASLTMRVYGYSSEDLPRCCPDLHTTLSWRWQANGYVVVDGGPAHAHL
jgi:hypothetical protein